MLDEAEVIFREVLGAEPNSVPALNGVGWVFWEREDFQRAAETFEKSIDLGPTSQGLAGLASSRRHLQQITLDEFSELLDISVALSPNYTWALREKGWGLSEFGARDDAVKAFRLALEIDPMNQWTVYGLASTYNEMGRYKDALEAMQEVEFDESTPTGLYSELSLTRFFLGDYREALKYADKTIEGWPDFGVGYVRKARALSALGRRPEAIALLRSREGIQHSNFVSYWLADLLADDGKLAEATDAIAVVFSGGEAASYDFELHAYLLLEQEKFAAARKAVDAGLALSPNRPYLLFYKALLAVADEDFDESERLMAQALENDGPDHLAKEYIKDLISKGEFTRAIRWRVEARDKTNADQ